MSPALIGYLADFGKIYGPLALGWVLSIVLLWYIKVLLEKKDTKADEVQAMMVAQTSANMAHATALGDLVKQIERISK